MHSIIDTPWRTTSALSRLKGIGVETIIRYYNFENSRVLPEKRIEAEEAAAIAAHGLTLAVVFQQRQNGAEDFSQEQGYRAGQRAARYAREVIGQPSGSGLYFAVDYDAGAPDIDRCIGPYFDGVGAAMADESGGKPAFRIGVYGSGLVAQRLLEHNCVELVWLSMSHGFQGTQEALTAGSFDLYQIAPATRLCGLDVDYNAPNPDGRAFGAFTPLPPAPTDRPNGSEADPAPRPRRYRVNARSGLNVRTGPGLSFPKVAVLPYGKTVMVREIRNAWARVDADCKTDHYVSADYLEHA